MKWRKVDFNTIINSFSMDDPAGSFIRGITIGTPLIFLLIIFIRLYHEVKKKIKNNENNNIILEDNTKSNILFFRENKKYLKDKNNYITIDDDIGYGSKKSVIFGLFFLGMGILIYYKVMPFFGLFFSLLGIAFIMQTIFIEYNKNKYKQVDLKLYKPSTALGNTLRGYITISTPLENSQFLISLENMHFYQTRKSNQEDGYETVNTESKVWSKTVKGYVKNNISNMEVHFNIDIPSDKYPSGSLRKNEYGGYYWILIFKEQPQRVTSLTRIYTIEIKEENVS